MAIFFPAVSLDKVKKASNPRFEKKKEKKATGGEIPVSILKECEFNFEFLKNCINKSIEYGRFWDSLKQGNITPIFKTMINPIADLSASYYYFQKYIKSLSQSALWLY